jgi:hypothetical protein
MICTFLSTIPVVGALLAVALPIAVLAAPTETGASSPITFITDLQGRVTLQRARAGAAPPLTHSEVLYAGDVLRTGQDGYATLFQRFAPMAVLAPQQTVTITPLPPVARDDVLTADGSAGIIRHFNRQLHAVSAHPPVAISKVGVLRQAQLQLMCDGQHTPPYYWAPFVLVGGW